MSLVRHGLADNALWLTDDGFALVRGHDLDLAVAPDARGHGEGRALAEAALTGAPADVTAWSHADHPAAAALARRFGFSATRALWVMTREAVRRRDPRRRGRDDPRLPGRPTPTRCSASTPRPSPTTPSRGRWTPPTWPSGWPSRGSTRRGCSSPTRVDGLLGFHWTKQHSAELGEVYVVAVDPAAQGRGLGKAVTAAGLAHLAARGVRRIILYVESDNEPAIATYSRLGFEHTSTHVQYSRTG